MKYKFLILGLALLTLFVYFNKQTHTVTNVIKSVFIHNDYINKKGNTIVTRVKVPKGYHRIKYSKGSYQEYLRHYHLKPFGSQIINYDDTPYFYQNGHVGILDLPVPKNGLQQCADALIRIRSEYLWQTNKKDKIGFQFTSGHYVSWLNYAKGIRPKIKGNKVTFSKSAKKDVSKTNFYNYLNLIFTYSGTQSLYTELPKITDSNLQLGDMLITPGFPGHVVILIDEIENNNGEKLFLLAQGNTPAQTVHVLKSVMNTSISPWVKLKNNERIDIPTYTFSHSKFIRFKD